MARWKHYEVWVQTGESKWEMTSLFPDAEVAEVAAKIRPGRVRLIEVLFEGSKVLSQELVQETGFGRPAA